MRNNLKEEGGERVPEGLARGLCSARRTYRTSAGLRRRSHIERRGIEKRQYGVELLVTLL